MRSYKLLRIDQFPFFRIQIQLIEYTSILMENDNLTKDQHYHHQKRLSSLAQKLTNSQLIKAYAGRILLLVTLSFFNIEQITFLMFFVCPLYIGLIVFIVILNIPLVYTFIKLHNSMEEELLSYETKQTKQNQVIQKAIGKIFKYQKPYNQSIEISSSTYKSNADNENNFCEHCCKNTQKYLFHCRLLNICLNAKKKKKYFIFIIFFFIFIIVALTVNLELIISQKKKTFFQEIVLVVSIIKALFVIFLLANYLNGKKFKIKKKQTQKSQNSGGIFFQKGLFKNQVAPAQKNNKQNQKFNSSSNSQTPVLKKQIKFNLNIRKRSKKTRQKNQTQGNLFSPKQNDRFNQVWQNTRVQNNQGKIKQIPVHQIQGLSKIKHRFRLNPCKEIIDETKDEHIRKQMFLNGPMQISEVISQVNSDGIQHQFKG